MTAPTCYCGSRMRQRSSRFGTFWSCVRWPACDGKQGAHQKDGSPLGVTADADTREARIQAHDAFDRLWKDAPLLYQIAETGEERKKVEAMLQRVARSRAYWWLRIQLGLKKDDCHIGNFDRTQCQHVVMICRDQTPASIREWAKPKKRRAG